MGAPDTTNGNARLSLYLLDTTFLVDHLRGDEDVTRFFRDLVGEGHVLGTTCVNVAEVERGIRPKERKATDTLLRRLRFFDTTREAARRAGRYQAEFERRGVTIHTADALIAGTARAHGAILLTNNANDFPMRDIRIEAPPASF